MKKKNIYIINLVVCRLNVYVGKERIHCLSVVRPVAMTQMQLSGWSRATEIQNNSSLLVIRHTRRVILECFYVLRHYAIHIYRKHAHPIQSHTILFNST